MKNTKWTTIDYNVKNSIFTNALLKYYVNKFWSDVMDKTLTKQHVLLIVRFKFNTNQVITVGKLQKINKTIKNDLIEYLIDRMRTTNEDYLNIPISSITFYHEIREGKINPVINTDTKLTNFQIFYNSKLPIGFKPEEYGVILKQIGNIYDIIINKRSRMYLESNGLTNSCQLIRNNRTIFTWIDTLTSKPGSPVTLIREIGKSMYYYEQINGVYKLILVKTIKKFKSITKTNINKNRNNKIITMDLETIIQNKDSLSEGGIHIPYLFSWTDGINKSSYFIKSISESSTLEENILEMIKKAIDSICIRKYKGYKVYFHNFSRFDAFFMIKYLAKLGKCEPIIHKGKIISLNFTSFNSMYQIQFKDSYLLLPSSLRKLCTSFNLSSSNSKGIFPYLLNDINYSGIVPKFEYFTGISPEEYNNYKASFSGEWNFRTEARKYCELDCHTLFQILSKFNDMIFSRTNLNINRFPTLPSLSFSLFRTHYLIKDSIKGLSGEVSDHIRSGYTGGAVDMYIPSPPEGRFIWGYDVNSLYPYVMKTFKMPIGTPTYFEGDIRKSDPNSFGFFFCKITSPESLVHPIIQTHVKTKEGIRTVSPLGSWEDMIFSPEMDNAIKYGYHFEIMKGYTFNSGFVFNNFVDELYGIRLSYPKTDPLNYIAKIILNSLYGRFGMSDEFIITEIISRKDYPNFEKLDKNKESIRDVISLGENLLVQCLNPNIELDTLLDNGTETHNVNIAIAAAITAYARIHMSQFKNNPLFNLYYSDTDSAYFDSPLPASFISNILLGKLKLEGIYNKAVFLAPKVYALRTQEGKEIIKIKGLTADAISKYNLSIEVLTNLLMKNAKLKFRQTKWFKDLVNANIITRDTEYTLVTTDSKRKLIYKNNKLIKTKALVINDNKVVLN